MKPQATAAARPPCPTREDLHAYAAGRLAWGELEDVARHVAGCPTCADALWAHPGDSDPLLGNLRGCQARPPFADEPECQRLISRARALPADSTVNNAGAPVANETPPPATKETFPVPFGKYTLLAELGRGGMGVVYHAQDKVLGRQVALKRVRSGLLADPGEIARFYREAQAVARLTHPNIVPLHEIGEEGGQHFFTMDFAAGGSLLGNKQRLAADPRRAAALVEKIARAVHYAHGKGILHRDLKPGNILLSEHGEPLVSDFGLAKFLNAEETLTQTGAVVGTPAYMAPEQTAGQGATLSPQSDIWSLGVMLYELLTGRRPFAGMGAQDLTAQIQRAEPPRPRALRPDLNRDLEAVVLKCLEKDPDWRYPTAEALGEDLARWRRGEPVEARKVPWPRRTLRAVRRRALVAFLLLVLGVAAAAAYVVRDLTDPDRPLRTVQRRLADGEAVTLIGQTGAPGWFRWLATEQTAGTSTAADEPFSVTVVGVNLLELLPDVRRPFYRFRAEIHHKSGAPYSRLGIYFFHRRYPSVQGVEHCYCEVTFNDCWKAPPNSKVGNVPIALHVRRYCEAGPNGDKWQRSCSPGPTKPSDPAGANADRWRRVVVEIGPQQVRVFWEGELIGVVTRAELSRVAREMLVEAPALLNEAPAEPFGEGLGLCVYDSAASIRSVVLEPLQFP
jgi:serine/threonine-protein kinase